MQSHRASSDIETSLSAFSTRTAGVKGYRQTEALAEIEADSDNVRLAWRGAIDTRELGAIARSAECLFVYYLYRNGYDEGVLEFGRAMAAVAGSPAADSDDGRRAELLSLIRRRNWLVSCWPAWVFRRR